MPSRAALRRRGLSAAARALGLHVEPLSDGAWLTQERAGRLRRSAVSKDDAGFQLLWDRRLARRRMNRVQRRMGSFLLREQVAWVLRATEANCVLDVGANDGQFGLALRRGGFRGRIVSFEPVASNLARLRSHAGSDPDWHVHGFALGADNGPAAMHRVEGTMSSLRAPSDFGMAWSSRLAEATSEQVEVRRLDAVYDEVTAGLSPARTFLKMDTQGFDLEVLRGASPAVTEQLVGLQSEVACLPLYDGMPRLAEQLTAYEDAGFETAGMFQVSRDVRTLRIIEFDLVMVRASAVRR